MVFGIGTIIKMVGGKAMSFLGGMKVHLTIYASLFTLIGWLWWSVNSLEGDKERLQKELSEAESNISLLKGQRENLRGKINEQNEQIQKWKDAAEEQRIAQEKRLEELQEKFENLKPIETKNPEELNQWLDKLFSQ